MLNLINALILAAQRFLANPSALMAKGLAALQKYLSLAKSGSIASLIKALGGAAAWGTATKFLNRLGIRPEWVLSAINWILVYYSSRHTIDWVGNTLARFRGRR